MRICVDSPPTKYGRFSRLWGQFVGTVCGDSLWGPTQPLRTQPMQGVADASGQHAAVSRQRFGLGDALHGHALCVPMQLP
jgi:hypothetical protein